MLMPAETDYVIIPSLLILTLIHSHTLGRLTFIALKCVWGFFFFFLHDETNLLFLGLGRREGGLEW